MFYFIPTLTTVKLYEHLKQDNDIWNGNDDDWTLIGSTDRIDNKDLPGVWLVNSDADNPQSPSPRQVQLWTDNPLASSASALGSGYRQFQGAIQPGKPLSERILDDYPDLMKCEHTKADQVCVNFKAAGNVNIEPGETWEYKDLRIISTFKAVSVRTGSAAHPP